MRYIVMAAAAVILLMWADGCQKDRRAAWQERARLALEQSEIDRQRAAEAVQRANEASALADRALLMADSLRNVRATVIERIRTVEVPAEAVPHTAPRDTAIALLVAENDTLRAALDARRVEVAALRDANVVLQSNVARLEAVLKDRPKERTWLPTLTVGYGATVSRQDRRIHDGPAVTIGWRIRL